MQNKTLLTKVLIFSSALLFALTGCVSSSDAPVLTGSYIGLDFPSEPFIRRDSISFSDDRFIHVRRYFDARDALVYVKSHWGYYKIAGDSLRLMDIGRDSVYDAEGIDLAKHLVSSAYIPESKTWKGYAFKSAGTGFQFREEDGGSGVWVTYLLK